MGEWMLGYIPAVGYYDVARLRDSDSGALFVWMDNYCQQNPLEAFETGVQKLLEPLPQDKPSPRKKL